MMGGSQQEMRVLSVRQPFADQILTPRPEQPLLPQKWCENRSWSTEHRGRLYIHASGKHRSLPTGAILGHVDLIDVVRVDIDGMRRFIRTVHRTYRGVGIDLPRDWSDSGVNWDSTYWWLLTHPVRLRKPIAANGQLRLWTLAKSPEEDHAQS